MFLSLHPKARHVPVLIVVNYKEKQDMLTKMQAGVSKQKRDWLGSSPASEFVQLFAARDENDNQMNWAQIIDKATEGMPGTTSRRITVTDPWGGRGHDFSVRDGHEHVEEHGGFLVITTFMPESERDWIQWKGRTARSDNKGQYAVMLRQSPLEPFEPAKQGDAAFLAQHRTEGTVYRDDIIAALLAEQDAKTEAKIDKEKGNILGGKRLNELCDKYYLTHMTGKATTWTSCLRDEKLCEFLASESGDVLSVGNWGPGRRFKTMECIIKEHFDVYCKYRRTSRLFASSQLPCFPGKTKLLLCFYTNKKK